MTTIAEKLTITDGALGDIKTAIEGKGVTPSGDITTYASAIGNISGGGSSGKYQLLQRVEDDNGNEIGTVSGFFTDANDVEYAVVCLDKVYRANRRDIGGFDDHYEDEQTGEEVIYDEYTTLLNTCANNLADAFSKKDTSTAITDIWYSQHWYSSVNSSNSVILYARSLSFTIDGETYQGQLPNMCELSDIAKNYSELDLLDTSSGSNSLTNIFTWPNYERGCYCCIPFNESYQVSIWVYTQGVFSSSMSESITVAPVLEIPNT